MRTRYALLTAAVAASLLALAPTTARAQMSASCCGSSAGSYATAGRYYGVPAMHAQQPAYSNCGAMSDMGQMAMFGGRHRRGVGHGGMPYYQGGGSGGTPHYLRARGYGSGAHH